MSESGRLRKAWEVRVKHYDAAEIVFAATAGKARSQVWHSLQDVTRIVDITARRAPWRDVTLPVRHPLADKLTDNERHCLLHAFGGNGDPINAGYRGYFYTRRDDPPLVWLTRYGLMAPMEGDRFGDGMTYFVLTDQGRHVALSLVPEYRR